MYNNHIYINLCNYIIETYSRKGAFYIVLIVKQYLYLKSKYLFMPIKFRYKTNLVYNSSVLFAI